MESLKQPTDLVPNLVDRLNKYLEDTSRPASDADEINPFVDLFKNMKNDLHTMEGSLPSISTCQKELITKFRLLECHIDNHVSQQQTISDDDITNQFNEIETTFQTIVKLISLFKVAEMKEKSISEQPSKQPNGSREEQGQLKLILGKKIDRNDVDVKMLLEHFEANFNCLESIQQKMCLLSLSVFPENSIIKKRPLIYWWMGERFGSYMKHKTAQETGDYIFHEFVRNGFLIPVRKNHTVERKNANGRPDSQSINAFFVNPWIHIVLIRIAQGKEYFRLDPESNLQQGSRRAFLLLDKNDITRLNGNGNGKDPLLSIFNLDERYLEFTEVWLSKLKKVEVLQLGRWQSSPKHHIEVEDAECLKGLGSQKYLRYLSLRGISQITTLPSSVSKLVSLEILDLRACHNLEKIRADLSSLRNLTHLDVSECYLLEKMPKGIEELKSLQVLKGYVMGNSGKNPCKLSQLSELKKLKKLSIRITSRAKVEDGEFSNLDKFKALQTLVVQWGAVSTKSVVSTNPSADATMSFTVPAQLKKLDLRCMPLVSLPEWIRPDKLPSLQKLYIRGGPITSLQSKDSQGNLKWGVKILRLKYLKDLEVEEEEFKNLFPEAKYIEKIACGMASDFIAYVE